MKRSLVLSAVRYQSDHESWSGCRSSALVMAPTGGAVCEDSTNSSDGATDEDSTAISAASSP